MCVRKVEKGFNGAPGGMEQGMGMGIGMASSQPHLEEYKIYYILFECPRTLWYF